MKIGRGRSFEETLESLREQEGLSELLKQPPSERQHYLPIVFLLPQHIRTQLHRDAIDWTNGWDRDTYYVQGADSLHLTLVGDISKPSTEVISIVRNYLSKISRTNLQLTLTEPSIGATGINCEVQVTEALKKLVDELHEILDMKTKPLTGISLIRYLIPKSNPNQNKGLIKAGLSITQKMNVVYNLQVNVDELHLVELDKVADYFQIIHTFERAAKGSSASV